MVNKILRFKNNLFVFIAALFFLTSKNSGELQSELIFDRILEKYLSIVSFELDFVLTQHGSSNEELQVVNGKFYCSSDSKFRLDFPGERIIYDGQWLWTWNTETNQVVVEEFDFESRSNFLFNVLRGRFEDFKNTSISSDELDESLVCIHLKALNENNYIQTVIVKADTNRNEIKSVEYYDFLMNHYTITLLNLNSISSSESLLFTIENINEKEVIDLRP